MNTLFLLFLAFGQPDAKFDATEMLMRKDVITFKSPYFDNIILQNGRLTLIKNGVDITTEQSFGENNELIFSNSKLPIEIIFEADDPGKFRIILFDGKQTVRFRNLHIPTESSPDTITTPVPTDPQTDVCICSIRNSHGCSRAGCDNQSACGQGGCYWDHQCPAQIAMPMMATFGCLTFWRGKNLRTIRITNKNGG